jgi:type IV secretion system protein TrbB
MLPSPETARWLDTMDRVLGPTILDLFGDEQITDICINPNGSVYAERVGEHMAKLDLRFSPSDALGLVRVVAKLVGAELHEDSPILKTRMPRYGLRFTGMIPPAVPATAVSMRRPASTIYSLEDYVDTRRMSRAAYDFMLEAVFDRRNVVVAGSTGSGKTTFTMAMLRAIGEHTPEDRVYLIEDTPELDIVLERYIENNVPTCSSAVAPAETLLKTALRMIPTRIVVGEVRGADALHLLEAWNTGHGGGVCTLHANSARDALHRLANLAAQGTKGWVPHDDVARGVELVVFLARRHTGRRVEQIQRVIGLDGQGGYVLEEVYDARK